MKKLGLDLGNRTLGIAVSDELMFLARGLETFRFEDSEFDIPLNYTKDLIKKYNIDVVVLDILKTWMVLLVGKQK